MVRSNAEEVLVLVRPYIEAENKASFPRRAVAGAVLCSRRSNITGYSAARSWPQDGQCYKTHGAFLLPFPLWGTD